MATLKRLRQLIYEFYETADPGKLRAGLDVSGMAQWTVKNGEDSLNSLLTLEYGKTIDFSKPPSPRDNPLKQFETMRAQDDTSGTSAEVLREGQLRQRLEDFYAEVDPDVDDDAITEQLAIALAEGEEHLNEVLVERYGEGFMSDYEDEESVTEAIHEFDELKVRQELRIFYQKYDPAYLETVDHLDQVLELMRQIGQEAVYNKLQGFYNASVAEVVNAHNVKTGADKPAAERRDSQISPFDNIDELRSNLIKYYRKHDAEEVENVDDVIELGMDIGYGALNDNMEALYGESLIMFLASSQSRKRSKLRMMYESGRLSNRSNFEGKSQLIELVPKPTPKRTPKSKQAVSENPRISKLQGQTPKKNMRKEHPRVSLEIEPPERPKVPENAVPPPVEEPSPPPLSEMPPLREEITPPPPVSVRSPQPVPVHRAPPSPVQVEPPPPSERSPLPSPPLSEPKAPPSTSIPLSPRTTMDDPPPPSAEAAEQDYIAQTPVKPPPLRGSRVQNRATQQVDMFEEKKEIVSAPQKPIRPKTPDVVKKFSRPRMDEPSFVGQSSQKFEKYKTHIDLPDSPANNLRNILSSRSRQEKDQEKHGTRMLIQDTLDKPATPPRSRRKRPSQPQTSAASQRGPPPLPEEEAKEVKENPPSRRAKSSRPPKKQSKFVDSDEVTTEELIHFYKKHDVAKLNLIKKIMKVANKIGRKKLNTKLENFYGANLETYAHELNIPAAYERETSYKSNYGKESFKPYNDMGQLKQDLIVFYEKYDPQKIKDIEQIVQLGKRLGRKKLVGKLEDIYGANVDVVSGRKGPNYVEMKRRDPPKPTRPEKPAARPPVAERNTKAEKSPPIKPPRREKPKVHTQAPPSLPAFDLRTPQVSSEPKEVATGYKVDTSYFPTEKRAPPGLNVQKMQGQGLPLIPMPGAGFDIGAVKLKSTGIDPTQSLQRHNRSEDKKYTNSLYRLPKKKRKKRREYSGASMKLLSVTLNASGPGDPSVKVDAPKTQNQPKVSVDNLYLPTEDML